MVRVVVVLVSGWVSVGLGLEIALGPGWFRVVIVLVNGWVRVGLGLENGLGPGWFRVVFVLVSVGLGLVWDWKTV